jgi:trehalose synthase
MDEAMIDPLPPDRFATVLPADGYARFSAALDRGADLLRGRTVWHVNTTLKGGGVAEMLSSLLPYLRGAGIDCRWVVIDGDEDFLAVTKRLHNMLHGFPGDGGDLGPAEADLYETTLARNADALLPRISDGDLVFVHDPQTAGLVPALHKRAAVVWHCHIGADKPSDTVRRAWDFLIHHVTPADRYVFSRAGYLWDGLDPALLRVIQPSIDAFSPKNQALDEPTADAILKAAGLLDGEPAVPPVFTRRDGSTGTVRHRQTIVDDGGPVPDGVPMAVQAARWDRLKDPVGVIDFFAADLAAAHPEVHLVLAGPAVAGVADDPEGEEVLIRCTERYRELPDRIRRRIHLVGSPMTDEEEAEAVVNALQRRADVVIQKSLAEGFGLAVAEAMWKCRPVVSARVGGIQDQIEHDRSGVLVDDPFDGTAFAHAVAALLDDGERAAAIGARAHDRVREHFLAPRQLTETMDVVRELYEGSGRFAVQR